MSVSSTANSSNSSASSPTSTRPVSISSSPVMIDCDNQISTSDDEKDSIEKKHKLERENTLGKELKLEGDCPVVDKKPKLEKVEEAQPEGQSKVEQKVVEESTGAASPTSKAVQVPPPVRCHNSSNVQVICTEQQPSDQVKLAASIVRLTPIQKSQLITGSNLPLIVRGHIVDNKQQDNRGIPNIINTPTAPATAFVIPSSSSQKIAISSSSSSNNNNNINQDNVWKLSNNNVVRLEATTSGSSGSGTLSKTSANTTKKLTPSRPDLVASSISNLHTIPIGAKTRPLLMNHNYRHNQLQGGGTLAAVAPATTATMTTGTASSDSAGCKVIQSLQNQTIATTLSSQLILSSIITANPGHKVQQISTIGGHSGLQFCLTPHQASQLAKFTPNTVNLIDTSSSIPGTSNQPSSNTLSGSTSSTTKDKTNTETTATTTMTTTTTTTTTIATATTNSPKSKLKSTISSCASATQASLDNPTPSPSAPSGGVTGQQTNAAAARLLDLGKKLLEATRECKVDQVRHLVDDAGAPFTSDWLGTTALHIAAQNGSPDIAEILIRAGVNRDARTKLERTALHMAAQSGCLEVVDLLVTNGADVNGRDMLKMTPLHWAVERGHVSVVERLLVAGADYKMKSKFKLTPVDMAREANLLDILELFKNWASGTREAESLDVYRELEASLNESHEFLDIDYHLALVDSATNSRDDSMLDTEEPCGIDLAALEWNKFDDFEPELFLPNEKEQDVQNVGYLMKVVEELQRENQQLRQKVEQLSTTDQ